MGMPEGVRGGRGGSMPSMLDAPSASVRDAAEGSIASTIAGAEAKGG